MKKIMFNEKYGLTTAVFEGKKTQTRRIPADSVFQRCRSLAFVEEGFTPYWEKRFAELLLINAQYCVGEEVAIAQSYHDTVVLHNGNFSGLGQTSRLLAHAGAKNKMFVKAEYMPHRIKITDVRVERLQEISDEDCLKEGVIKLCDSYRTTASDKFFHTPQEAFAILIDKVSGKGTWESNPWVFVYEFELVK